MVIAGGGLEAMVDSGKEDYTNPIYLYFAYVLVERSAEVVFGCEIFHITISVEG